MPQACQTQNADSKLNKATSNSFMSHGESTLMSHDKETNKQKEGNTYLHRPTRVPGRLKPHTQLHLHSQLG